MNDAIRTRGTSVDQARKNLETMLDMTLKKFPQCEIILMSMNPDVKHLLLKRSASGRPNLPRYYAMYADVAKKRVKFAVWVVQKTFLNRSKPRERR